MEKTKNNRILTLAATLIVVFFGTAVLVSAQDPRFIGGAGITVFDDTGFRGTAQTFQYDMADLRSSGLDNRISSLRVGPGEQWEVCEERNYQGRCIVVSGQESDLGRNNWNNRISSIRRTGGGGGYPGGPGGPGWGGGQTSSPPSWARGTFYGVDPASGTQITLTLSNNGQVTSSGYGSTSYGTYYNGYINMEGVRARVSRAGNGIQTTRSDTGVTTSYSRTSGGGGGGGTTSPPSWARGTFYGSDPSDGAQIVLTITNNGRVTSRSMRQVSTGTYNNGMIYMEGVSVRVSRFGNGIRTVRVDNGQVVDYRRN